jgi:hypothetical protein
MKSSRNPKVLNYVIKNALDPVFSLLNNLVAKESEINQFIDTADNERKTHINDEHYLSIKENPEQEIFNPFHNLKHMQLVMLEFKRGLITTCVSQEASENHPLEVQEEFIRFHYEKVDGVFTTGFVNAENEGDLKLLYSYSAPDIISAIWGLCVTAYNAEDRKHAEYFYDIEKAWRKAKRISDKWEDEKRSIIPKIKVMQQESVGFQHIDLSDSATNKISEFGNNYFIGQDQMDDFLLSLFNINSLELIDFSDKEDRPPIAKKEKVWQYPDFASDKVIFAEPNKKQAGRQKPVDIGNTVDAIPFTDTDKRPDDIILSEAQVSPVTEAADITETVTEDKSNQNASVTLIPSSPSQVSPEAANQAEKDDHVYLFGPGWGPMGKGTPATPFSSPYGTFPVGPGPFWGSPVQPFMPPSAYFEGANSFAGNPMMGPGQFMGQNPFQSVPQNINQIDFESKDHPDPFQSYR